MGNTGLKLRSECGKEHIDDIKDFKNKFSSSNPDWDCKCISTLSIHGHGDVNGINFGPQIADTATEAINPDSKIAMTTTNNMDALDDVPFCEKCTIYMLGCNVGGTMKRGSQGSQYTSFIDDVAKRTGCRVVAPIGNVHAGSPDSKGGWVFSDGNGTQWMPPDEAKGQGLGTY